MNRIQQCPDPHVITSRGERLPLQLQAYCITYQNKVFLHGQDHVAMQNVQRVHSSLCMPHAQGTLGT